MQREIDMCMRGLTIAGVMVAVAVAANAGWFAKDDALMLILFLTAVGVSRPALSASRCAR